MNQHQPPRLFYVAELVRVWVGLMGSESVAPELSPVRLSRYSTVASPASPPIFNKPLVDSLEAQHCPHAPARRATPGRRHGGLRRQPVGWWILPWHPLHRWRPVARNPRRPPRPPAGHRRRVPRLKRPQLRFRRRPGFESVLPGDPLPVPSHLAIRRPLRPVDRWQ